jgi:anti-sigma factor ChrR (cupin superfamily)
MKIRADFKQEEIVRPGDVDWVPSPQAGVDRIMLDRIGEEVARATSFVRFAPESYFPHHEHGGGEEVFVLDGVFEDEYGRYPAGTYMRDPTGSSHAPFTKEGCTLYVKLWQFLPGDEKRVTTNTELGPWQTTDVPGLTIQPLHRFDSEQTRLLRLAPGNRLEHEVDAGGEEVLVLSGSFQDEQGTYPQGSWLRHPGSGQSGSKHSWVSDAGCTLLVKSGHLPHARAPKI